MTQPRRIQLFPRAIYLDTLLTSSGSRGRILEELVAVMHHADHYLSLREWIHQQAGEKGWWSERTSVFVPSAGFAAAHQWFFGRNNRAYSYTPGPYVLDIIEVSSARKTNNRKLFSVTFWVEKSDIENAYVFSDGKCNWKESGHIELDWNFFDKHYEVTPIPKLEEGGGSDDS